MRSQILVGLALEPRVKNIVNVRWHVRVWIVRVGFPALTLQTDHAQTLNPAEKQSRQFQWDEQ